MSYLKWNLDLEDGIDIVDPLGDLSIIGDEGKLIEQNICSDTFLEALVEATHSIKIGKNINVDPIDEPNDLEFYCDDNGFKIVYGKQRATIFNKYKFIKDLQEVVKQLLEILDEQAAIQKIEKRKLVKLRDYLILKL